MAAVVASTLSSPISACQVALRGDIGHVHSIEIHQLQFSHANGRELQGNLPADGAHADHGDRQLGQPRLPALNPAAAGNDLLHQPYQYSST